MLCPATDMKTVRIIYIFVEQAKTISYVYKILKIQQLVYRRFYNKFFLHKTLDLEGIQQYFI